MSHSRDDLVATESEHQKVSQLDCDYDHRLQLGHDHFYSHCRFGEMRTGNLDPSKLLRLSHDHRHNFNCCHWMEHKQSWPGRDSGYSRNWQLQVGHD